MSDLRGPHFHDSAGFLSGGEGLGVRHSLFGLKIAFVSSDQRGATDFGEFAWLTAFDEDDQRTFRRELLDALVQSLASDSVEPAERCISEWRTTARALSNEKSRRILTGAGDDDAAFEEVARPE